MPPRPIIRSTSSPPTAQSFCHNNLAALHRSVVTNVSNLKCSKFDYSAPLSVDEKIELITRNLQEAIGVDELRQTLEAGQNLKLYWGTAPTGKPHIAYFVPMMKLADFLKAGCEVTVLFANIHAYLDNMKSNWEVLEYRTQYYETMIKGMLTSCGVPLERLHFVTGKDYQLTERFTRDVYRSCTLVSDHNAKRAGADVVKQVSDAKFSGLLYPLLQALDEEHLGVQAQFGGVDQRKIFILAQDLLPQMGMSRRIHFMNPMVPGLTGSKMSASDPNSKIDLLDSAESVRTKLSFAVCESKELENNGVLSFIKNVLFSALNGTLSVKLDESNSVSFSDYASLEKAFIDKSVTPSHLKASSVLLPSSPTLLLTLPAAMSFYLNSLLEPIREVFSDPKMQDLALKAYPTDVVPHPVRTIPPAPFVASSSDLPIDDRVSLITRNLSVSLPDVHSRSQSLSGESKIREILSSGRDLTVSFSIPPSGKLHIGHYIPLLKIGDLVSAGCKVKIVIADMQAYFDNLRGQWDSLKSKDEYYIETLKLMLSKISVPLTNIEFVKGSDYQFKSDYVLEVYKISSLYTQQKASMAGLPLLKSTDDLKMSSLLYPIFQTVDEECLLVDAQLGGSNNHALFQNAEEHLPLVGFDPRIHLETPLLPSITGDSMMNCCDLETAIDILDSSKVVETKIKKAFCEPANVEKNPVLEIAKHLVFPMLHGQLWTVHREGTGSQFIPSSTEKYGGNVAYTAFSELEADYRADNLFPLDLKNAVRDFLKATYLINLDSQSKQYKATLKTAFTAPAPAESGPFEKCCLKVGKVLEVQEHPNSDKLFVVTVDMGESAPRQICAGIRGSVPKEELLDHNVVAFANLKPRSLGGVESNGMILCCSSPAKLEAGEIVTVDGEGHYQEAAPINTSRKNNPFSLVMPDLAVDGGHVACYKGKPWKTSSGPCKVASMTASKIE